MTTQPDTDAPPTHTPGCSLSTAEASGHNRCGCWCHAGPPFRYTPDEVAAVLRPDLGRCHRETCEHGHVDHRPRNACRWCDCKAFVPSDAPPTRCECGALLTADVHGPECDNCPDPGGHHAPSVAPQAGRPTTPQTEAGRRLLSELWNGTEPTGNGGRGYGKVFARDSRRMWEQDRDRIIAIEREAAAGALPSVERLARAMAEADEEAWGTDYTMYARKVHARLATPHRRRASHSMHGVERLTK
jgi:hypothetical protein